MNAILDWLRDYFAPVIDLQAEFVSAFGETLFLAGSGLVIGGFFGLVIGTALYVTRSGGIAPNAFASFVLNVLVNFFRPIPFILLAVALQPFSRAIGVDGIGTGHAVVAIIFGSAFGIGRIVEQNLVSVDPGVLEAARSMGASRWQVVRTVLLPEALGPLILGFTFAMVAIVDMTAVVGTIGAGGLGQLALTEGYRQYQSVVTWTAVVIVILIVQVGQFAGNALARKVLRR
jgi:D-methionine transport system permease protein